MTTKHTPGPWTWEEGQSSITKSWNGKDHQVACVDYKKLAWHEDSNCAGRESGANARLIAEAPNLLEAAQKVLSNKRGEDDWLILTVDCQDLAAAIAKATGETP